VFRFAEEAAFRFIEETKEAAHASALHAADFIHNGVIVLTHSRSSTVSEAFVEARLADRTFAVIATESRPMLEGRTVAESLSRKGIRVTLIADAAASLMMDEVNLILVGADQVRPEVLINKIGTHVIALAAREKKLPVYAACDGSKFISKEYSDGLEPNKRTASELWASAPPGIDIVNRYFEAVPIELFTGIITEAGVLSIDEASRRAEAASIDGELEDALDSRRGRIR
jgi:translation initiation factor eIF-2B subunit delta